MPRWLRKLKHFLLGFQGTLIYCPKCKGMHVNFGETTIVGNTESYDVNCKDCGAKGKITEVWN
jgi:hypothetical protein